MKKFFLILFVLFLLAAIGITAFILTFDANQWKPLIIQNLEPLLGNKVKIDNLSLKWNNGIALNVEQFEIHSNKLISNKPLLEIQDLAVTVKLLPLLHNDIQIASLELSHPRIQVNRMPNGLIEILGIDTHPKSEPNAEPMPRSSPLGRTTSLVPKTQKATGKETPVSAAVPLSFLIRVIKISDGDILFYDQTLSPPAKIHIRKLDLTLKNVSLARWIDFQAQAELFAHEPNVNVSGRLRLAEGSGIQLEGAKAETRLEDLDFSELTESIPQLKNTSFSEGYRGSLFADIQQFENSEHYPIKNISAKIQFKNGLIPFGDVGQSIQNANANLIVDTNEIKIQKLNGNLAAGKQNGFGDHNAFSLQGSIKEWLSLPKFSFQTQLQKINLEDVIPPARRGDPQLVGMLDLSFQGNGIGKSWEQISNSLAGQGNLNLDQAAVLNLNLLKEILGKMSMIPGLIDRLKQQLPEKYWDKLNEKDTSISNIQQNFDIRNGILTMDHLAVATETAQLTGSAEIRLDGELAVQTMIFIEPQLSSALVKSVAELQYLTDQDGRVQLPIKINGLIPSIRVFPDLQYIGTRLATAKTQELLSNLFKKNDQNGTQTSTSTGDSMGNSTPQQTGTQNDSGYPNNTQPDQQTYPQPQQTSPQEPFNLRKVKGKDLLGSLLQAALDSSSPQNPDTQSKTSQ